MRNFGEFVCVLGMHRSGTSCLTGILQELGLNLGQVHTRNPFNARGNRENPQVMELNDALLAHNGACWDSPVEASRWNDEHLIAGEKIVRALATGEAPWGFKDPRTLFTLSFWSEFGQPRAIGTVRDPRKVAGSLAHRNGFSVDRSFDIWLAYNQRLLEVAKRSPSMPLVNFDLPPDDYIHQVLRAARQVGLGSDKSPGAPTFFDQDLKHQENSELLSESAPAPVDALYRELLELSRRRA